MKTALKERRLSLALLLLFVTYVVKQDGLAMGALVLVFGLACEVALWAWKNK